MQSAGKRIQYEASANFGVSSTTRTSSVAEPRISGFTMAVIANILWGTSFLASKHTLTAWGPLTSSALRFAVALLALSLVLPLAGCRIRLKGFSWQALKGISMVGITGFGVLYPLQLKGLTSISSGLSAAIMLTSPLFVLAFNAMLFRGNLSLNKVVALLLGLGGGLILLFGQDQSAGNDNVLFGAALTFLASMSLALSVLATRAVSQHVDAGNLTFWSMFVGLLLLLPFAAQESMTTEFVNPSTAAIASLIYLGVVCSAVCFWLWNSAIAKSSPAELATTMHLKTPTAVLLGALIASESISFVMIVGILVVAAGVFFSQWTASVKGMSR